MYANDIIAIGITRHFLPVSATPAVFPSLPPHLSERAGRDCGTAAPRAHGEFVLYWARTALRAHENPALDAAIIASHALDKPLFVYHGLSERYPYASDRHHMFILECARDFSRELTARGIGNAFHLERAGHRGPHLATLAARASLVVTELMPVAPLSAWTHALRTRIDAPVWEIDTACVVPVPLTSAAFERAFVYRDTTARLRRARLTAPWPEVPHRDAPFIPTLPFVPVSLADANFAALLSECQIDHAVGPVADTRGGSVAGYARWHDFVHSGRIDQYDRTRNDPTRADGVSRMSAYLHYGAVSPFRLARETANLASEGAAKWLDELLVWRELAYTFCYHRADHDTINAIPAWARATLAERESDARVLLTWEQLARGESPDAFWNAMQHSLLAHGELHNNVRMTWGKALLSWTPNAQRALAMLVDLNHRYALDGRDPASFGGILWCLGQFDRAFTPSTSVLGTVRTRALSAQAERINVSRYSAHVQRPVHRSLQRVAVIGAGMSGLMCARTLADHNGSVTVFEKSRGFGGRCATRHEGIWQFDHGAQYFTVRDARLSPLMQSWLTAGIIAEWQGVLRVREGGEWSAPKSVVRRWVAVPGMNALAAHLATDLDVRRETQIAHVQHEGRQWRLVADSGADLGTYDVVLCAIPAAQAHALLSPIAPALAEQAGGAVMHPTIAMMLVLETRPDVPWDGAFLNDDDVLSWISRDNSKPQRSEMEQWVLHATRRWSAEHLDSDRAQVGDAMLSAFARVTGESRAPVFSQVHRWKYALPDPVTIATALYDSTLGLGAAGDWCGGPRVEGAMLSGLALAGRVLTHAHCGSAQVPL